MFHSLWVGDKEEKYGDLLFVYYTKESLKKITEVHYDIVELGFYTEMEKNDSFYVILKNKDT